MKWLLLLVLFFPALASAQGCTNTTYGHWTCIQSTKNSNNGGDVSVTLNGVVSGHLLLIEGQSCLGSVGGCDLNVNTPTATDNVNGSWGTCGVFFQGAPLPSLQTFICAYCGTASGNITATHQFSPNTGNRNFHVALFQEWGSSDGSCDHSTGGFDATGNNASNSQSPPWTVTSSSSHNPNELAVAIMAPSGQNVTSVNGPFALVDSDTTNHDFVAAAPAATATTYTATFNDTSAAQFGSVIATFRISATAGLTSPKHKSQIIKYRSHSRSRRIPWDRTRKTLELEKA